MAARNRPPEIPLNNIGILKRKEVEGGGGVELRGDGEVGTSGCGH